MTRLYGDPVQVQARPDGRPSRFVWRSRLYIVRAILEHWVINREWWRDPPPQAPAEAEAGAQDGSQSAGLLQPELEFWRVEAATGQGKATGVYELRQEMATGTWMLRYPLAALPPSGLAWPGPGQPRARRNHPPRTDTGWSLEERLEEHAAVSLRMTGDAAWRLLTGARYDEREVILSGDPALARPLLQVRGIIV